MPKLQRYRGSNPSEVRARVLEEVGTEATIVRAGKERSGGVLGFFQKETFVLDVEVPESDGDAPEQPRHASVVTEGSPLDSAIEATTDVLSLSDSATDANRTPHSVGAGGFEATLSGVLEEAEMTLVAAAQPGLYSRVGNNGFAALVRSMPERADEPADGDAAAPPVAVERASHDGHADRSSLAARLCALGVPASLLVTAEHGSALESSDDAIVARLLAALGERSRPIAPPDEPGGAIVVLGAAVAARRLAALVRGGLDAPGDAVVRASLRASAGHGGQGATRYRSSLEVATAVVARKIAGLGSIVTLDWAPTAKHGEFVREVVAGICPVVVWLAVPASADASTLEAARSSAGRLDAIALYDLDGANEPARLLASSVPVAYLDWREAAPLMWTARLVERANRSSR